MSEEGIDLSTKYLSGVYPAGYTLSAAYTGLVIESSASIGGSGVSAYFKASVANYGTIQATGDFGVYLTAGGTVTNGSGKDKTALIEASHGVWAQYGSATVANFGTIDGDVFLRFGGAVTNGGARDTRALIEGVYARGASTKVTNLGTILDGVYLLDGGEVINGSAKNATATITSVCDRGAPGSITNFGTIQGDGSGVVLSAGGFLTNGSASDTRALIVGAASNPQANAGVYVQLQSTVANFGTITGAGVDGVELAAVGTITNGTTVDTSAIISGQVGIAGLTSAGNIAISNFGTIQGAGLPGVSIQNYASVVNGAATDASAMITGIYLGFGVVTNFGTVSGDVTFRNGGDVNNSGEMGASTEAGVVNASVVVNGSAANTNALISGPIGVYDVYRSASIANFGTIAGAKFAGVFLEHGGLVTNGSTAVSSALISGGYGVYMGAAAPGTVDNFGTIAGSRGVAVSLGSAKDQLDVENASTFVGAVLGDGGTLDLASGTGTFALSPGDDVIVSGGIAITTFQNFGTVEVGAGATFSDTDAVVVAEGRGLIAAGSLTLGGAGQNSVVNDGLIEVAGVGSLDVAGAVTNDGALAVAGGTLTVTGAVTGSGTATIASGRLTFASSFEENVLFQGKSGALHLAQSQNYSGTISGVSATDGLSLDLADIGFVNSGEATFTGNQSSGVLNVTDGTHTASLRLSGDFYKAVFIAASDGNGGTIVYIDKSRRRSSPPLAFIAAMAQIGGSNSAPIHLHSPAQPISPFLSRPHSALA